MDMTRERSKGGVILRSATEEALVARSGPESKQATGVDINGERALGAAGRVGILENILRAAVLEPVNLKTMSANGRNQHLRRGDVEGRLRNVDSSLDGDAIDGAIIGAQGEYESTFTKDGDRSSTNTFNAAFGGTKVGKKLGIINNEPVSAGVGKEGVTVTVNNATMRLSR